MKKSDRQEMYTIVKLWENAFLCLMVRKCLSVCINDLILFIVLNATFSNISAISLRPVLVVEEARVLRENHRP